MSAFFEWDTEPVVKSILAELAKQGRSINPEDHPMGQDSWDEITRIDLPDYLGLKYFTDEWDVNIWDNDGELTVTAYPVYDGVTECSAWLTCSTQPVEEWKS